jgi:hypothetical protein
MQASLGSPDYGPGPAALATPLSLPHFIFALFRNFNNVAN